MSGRAVFAVVACLMLQSCGHTLGHHPRAAALVVDGLDRAIVLARQAYRERFPLEYSETEWDIETVSQASSWLVMFAYPLPDDLLDVPRSGRLFIVAKDDYRILDTMIM